MDTISKFMGIKQPEGPTDAEKSAQTAQLTKARREEISAKAGADAAAATGSLKDSTSFKGGKKDKFGG